MRLVSRGGGRIVTPGRVCHRELVCVCVCGCVRVWVCVVGCVWLVECVGV